MMHNITPGEVCHVAGYSRYTMVLVGGEYNLNEHAIKKNNYHIVTAVKVNIRVAFDCVAWKKSYLIFWFKDCMAVYNNNY